jgi:solute carrier family 13 (sodium-dependent dicarboxylate transporter), member 2/3/5
MNPSTPVSSSATPTVLPQANVQRGGRFTAGRRPTLQAWARLVACGAAAAGLWALHGVVGGPAWIALAVFGAAIVAWVVLRLDETPVALAAALALVGFGVVPSATLFDALGSDLVWLMLGSFVLAAVLQASGAAERWTRRWLAGATRVSSLFTRLTWGIAATAFVVPSTSARAALLLPVFVVLVRAADDARIARALALLFPSVILLSAGASLTGAGAHLVATDLLRRLGEPAPGFLGWAALAAPVSFACCWAARSLVMRLFLTPAERSRGWTAPVEPVGAVDPASRRAGAIVLGTVAGFAFAPALGIDLALVAIAAALLATVRPLTGVDLATALKRVDWNLLLFLAATMVLGEALVSTGAAAAVAAGVTATLPATAPPWAWLALAGAVAVVSHLVITSRTARALVLLPTVALPMAALGQVDPSVVVLLMVLGSGYCQTLVVSAKPVLVFHRVEGPTFSEGDLLRLGVVLAPVVFVLLVATAVLLWPLQGLALAAG